MLNYNHLYYFHVVAMEGGIAAASERLGVTQPTISEQLKLLQTALGAQLFTRQKNMLRLTDIGRQVYEQTTAMFRASERVLEVVGKPTPKHPEMFRIGITPPVSRSVTAALLLPLFSGASCVASMRTDASHELLHDLREGDLDLALCESEPNDKARRGLHVMTIHRPELVAIAGPSVHVQEAWSNVELVHYRASSAYRSEVDTYLEANELSPRVVAEADDPATMVEAVLRGPYVAFVPRGVARDALAGKRVTSLAAFQPSHAGVHAVFHQAPTSQLVRRAVDLLASHVKEREA